MRVFSPFQILVQKKRLGIALRFLRYVLLVPRRIVIPQYVRDTCDMINIGSTYLDIAALFFRDLPYLEASTPSYLQEDFIQGRTKQLDERLERRSFHTQQLMKDLP